MSIGEPGYELEFSLHMPCCAHRLTSVVSVYKEVKLCVWTLVGLLPVEANPVPSPRSP